MSIAGIGAKRRRDTTITIDVSDYMDLFDDSIEPEDARRLYHNLQNVHANLVAHKPNIQEALIYLERVLPIAATVARKAQQ